MNSIVRRMVWVAFAIFTLSGFVPAPSEGGTCLDFVGRWPYGDTRAMAVDGDTLLFGSGSAMRVADVSDPANLTIVSDVTLPDFVRDIAISGVHVYVACGRSGLQIVDISTPSAPVVVGQLTTPGIAVALAAAGNHVYLAAGEEGFRIIDVSDPSAPTEVGVCCNHPESSLIKVAVSGNYAFVGDRTNGLRIIDISFAPGPTEVALLQLGTYPNVVSLLVSGNYAYVTSAGWLSVIDVSIPATPSIVGTLNISTNSIAKLGHHLYVDHSGGRDLAVIDVSNPASPLYVTSRPTRVVRDIVAASGFVYLADDAPSLIVFDANVQSNPWRAKTLATHRQVKKIFAKGDKVYVADNGPIDILRILDLTDPARPQELGSVGLTTDYSADITGIHATDDLVLVAAKGLFIVDASDPHYPTEIGSYDDVAFNGGRARGDYAYMGMVLGFWVMDISDPHYPSPVADLSWNQTIYSDFGLAANYAYLGKGGSELEVVDISDPTAPFVAGSCPGGGVFRIRAYGDWTFAIGGGYSEFFVYDVSNPAAPFQAADLHIDGAQGLEVSDGQAYVDTVYIHQWPVGIHALEVVDIRNPISPQRVCTEPLMTSHVYDTAIFGDHLFVALSGKGINVYRKSDAVFFGDFETEDAARWSAMVRDQADNFNFFLESRGIGGDYIQCSYDGGTGDYTYLGQTFSEANGGLGGAPILNWIDLYWKNEELASTVPPYASEDADSDGTINSADADAFDASVL